MRVSFAEDVGKLRLGHEGLPVSEVCNWGEPQRAPQLRVDLAFRHSRYIFELTVRPLGFVPTTIEPKSRTSICLRLILIDDDFLPNGHQRKRPALYSPNALVACTADLSEKLALEVPGVAFFPRLLHTRRQPLTFEVPLSTCVIGNAINAILSAELRECAQKH